MLTALQLQNWKSFGGGDDYDRRTLPLSPLTVFTGPNASGKSNALEALRFMQGAALDYPLGDVLNGRWEGGREIWPSIRGGVAEAPHWRAPGFGIETRWRFVGHQVSHGLMVSTSGDVALESEYLRDARNDYFFDTLAHDVEGDLGRLPDGGLRVAMRADGQGESVAATYSSTQSLLGQVQLLDGVDPAVVETARAVRRALREAAFLDIRPSMMRSYQPASSVHLGISGENISPVLAALVEDRRRDVVDWLSELCAPEIESIEFDRTQLGEVMMFVVERGGRRISARSVSDGTFRFLGILVSLLTVPEGSMVIVEEPDVGLEPSRIGLLAEILESLPARRNVQIIATTHSPTLLAHLSEKSLGNVVAFWRDPKSGNTVCSRLEALPHFGTLRGADNIEHLISTGWLERAL